MSVNSIGLFGGTFNPVHLGHLRAALEVKEEMGLDHILLIPSALPPHKKPDNMASARDRLEMLRMAVQGNPDFSVSDIELNREGPSFTIDTISRFKSLYQGDSRLFFIIGSDAFLELNTWKSYIALLRSIAFIVMTRPTPDHIDASAESRIFKNFIVREISPGYVRHGLENRFDHPDLSSIRFCSVTPLDISSTRIRELIRTDRSIKYLVPEQVEKYIQTKGLYA
jgi:nicotinate-nucleotide adenylyltransferase